MGDAARNTPQQAKRTFGSRWRDRGLRGLARRRRRLPCRRLELPAHLARGAPRAGHEGGAHRVCAGQPPGPTATLPREPSWFGIRQTANEKTKQKRSVRHTRFYVNHIVPTQCMCCTRLTLVSPGSAFAKVTAGAACGGEATRPAPTTTSNNLVNCVGTLRNFPPRFARWSCDGGRGTPIFKCHVVGPSCTRLYVPYAAYTRLLPTPPCTRLFTAMHLRGQWTAKLPSPREEHIHQSITCTPPAFPNTWFRRRAGALGLRLPDEPRVETSSTSICVLRNTLVMCEQLCA